MGQESRLLGNEISNRSSMRARPPVAAALQEPLDHGLPSPQAQPGTRAVCCA